MWKSDKFNIIILHINLWVLFYLKKNKSIALVSKAAPKALGEFSGPSRIIPLATAPKIAKRFQQKIKYFRATIKRNPSGNKNPSNDQFHRSVRKSTNPILSKFTSPKFCRRTPKSRWSLQLLSPHWARSSMECWHREADRPRTLGLVSTRWRQFPRHLLLRRRKGPTIIDTQRSL